MAEHPPLRRRKSLPSETRCRRSHPLTEDIREPPLPERDQEFATQTDSTTNRNDQPRATMFLADAEDQEQLRRRSSARSPRATLLHRSFSLPRSTFDPSRFSMPASQFSNWDQSSQASTSSTYSSLLARKDSVKPRPSLTPLNREPLERFHVALEDFVTEMVPNNIYELACKHLPRFTAHYAANFVKCVQDWADRLTADTLKMLRESMDVRCIENAIEVVALAKRDPGNVKERLRALTPAGALATSKAPKHVAKCLRYQKKFLDRAKKEKEEKEALIAEKVQLLTERLALIQNKKEAAEEMAAKMNASDSYNALLDAFRQEVIEGADESLLGAVGTCIDDE